MGARPVTLLEALADPRIFPGTPLMAASWRAWRVFLHAVFARPCDDEDLAVYRACTGRAHLPAAPVEEAWVIVGRRGGKSRTMAHVVVWCAAFVDVRRYLAPGERGVFMIIAADRKQATRLLNYCRGLLQASPVLRRLVATERADTIELTTGVDIEVTTCSSVSVRSATVVGAVCDEIAFWPADDAADPDREVLAALRPAMSTIPHAPLIAISSPYARRGELWRAYREHFGQEGDPVLVWQAPTDVMHPGNPKLQRDAAKMAAADPARAAAEYGAVFRSDVEALVSPEVLDACTAPGRHERPPLPASVTSPVTYRAAVDPSGGSADSFTLAIAHAEGPRAVLDLVREVRPPFSPDATVEAFAAILRPYGVTTVVGDRYAGLWPRERFAAHGITYQVADTPKSEVYLALLPLLNSGRVELLDVPRLRAQLGTLERRTARGGRDTVDHGPGAHDDVANAAALALVAAAGGAGERDALTHYEETEAIGDPTGRGWARVPARF